MLNTLKPASGSRRYPKRVARGPGSGKGRTGGRGIKGQLSRSGSKKKPGFEGGQMPLIRRLPKRGFSSRSRVEYSVVNLEALNVFAAGSEVTPEVLVQAGFIKGRQPVKILGSGKLERKLTVKAHKFSGTAKEMIVAAGGRIEEIKR